MIYRALYRLHLKSILVHIDNWYLSISDNQSQCTECCDGTLANLLEREEVVRIVLEDY